MTTQFESDLLRKPELVEQILREFPPVKQPRLATIRTDEASVDLAIARGLSLAIDGTESRIELMP